ncbi:hypothetical protein [Sulfobacillus thermosulfidooxidans]|uniref:hypothetical protein n=1 Tax=Sulfobacillus thermosulfidooxidans TaxID=28034 RepID=UPI0006B4A2B4|nr:hypothetical protein [Sulfobacillus thermosulfidooxidans]
MKINQKTLMISGSIIALLSSGTVFAASQPTQHLVKISRASVGKYAETGTAFGNTNQVYGGAGTYFLVEYPQPFYVGDKIFVQIITQNTTHWTVGFSRPVQIHLVAPEIASGFPTAAGNDFTTEYVAQAIRPQISPTAIVDQVKNIYGNWATHADFLVTPNTTDTTMTVTDTKSHAQWSIVLPTPQQPPHG